MLHGIAEANISVLGITSIQQNVELLAKSACELLLLHKNFWQPVEANTLMLSEFMKTTPAFGQGLFSASC